RRPVRAQLRFLEPGRIVIERGDRLQRLRAPLDLALRQTPDVRPFVAGQVDHVEVGRVARVGDRAPGAADALEAGRDHARGARLRQRRSQSGGQYTTLRDPYV